MTHQADSFATRNPTRDRQPRFLRARRSDVHSDSRFSQFWYPNKVLRQAVVQRFSGSMLPAGARVLDYGCANRPYEALLPSSVQYVGADLPGNERADLVLTPGGGVPSDDGEFDVVMSTQVLEHVDDTMQYLQECNRVLKPGGRLLLSTHGMMYYHRDPEDYWRWTPAGLRKIVEAAGFQVSSTAGLVGIGAVGLQIFQDGTIYLLPRVIRPLYAVVMQTFVALVDRLYNANERAENCWTILLDAVKTEPAGAVFNQQRAFGNGLRSP